MRRLNSIVALNQDGAIGCQNALPWRLKTDMAFFRQQTLGNIVIMGRKTFDSLNRRPLAGRFNVVVSRSFGLFESSDIAVQATGIAEALKFAESAPRKKYGEIFVVGGQTMYEQLAPIVDRYLITVVDMPVVGADTFFDQGLIAGDEWSQRSIKAIDACDGIDEASFTVTEFVRERTENMITVRDAMTKRKQQSGQARKASLKRLAPEPAMSVLC